MKMPPPNYINFPLCHSLLQKIRELNSRKNLCHERRVDAHRGQFVRWLWHKLPTTLFG